MTTVRVTIEALVGGGGILASLALTAGYVLGRFHGEEDSRLR